MEGRNRRRAGHVRRVRTGDQGLFGARSAAVSPDGKNVYLASQFANTLVVFDRDLMTGQLEFVEAHRNGMGGVDGLGDAREVVVSPEGTHVYVASAGDSALVVFARDVMTGRLSFVQVQREGLPGDGLDYGPVGLALSPDGASVYAAGVLDNAVAVFSRDPGTGLLTPIEVASIGLPVAPGAFVYREPGGVAVSSDGAQVYAVGGVSCGSFRCSDDAVTAFQRDPQTGQLTRIGSWREGADGVQGMSGAFAPSCRQSRPRQTSTWSASTPPGFRTAGP